MIKEEIIEKVLDQLEKAEFDIELGNIKAKYPVLHAYLMNDQLEALTEEEFKLFLFDALVIIRSFEAANSMPEELNAKWLEDKESDNWNLLQNSKPVNFHEKLDVFFQDTHEEDLLAFVEDSLVDDEESPISSAAREIMFICLKSIMDLLDKDEV